MLDEFVKQHNFIGWFKTSAQDNVNIGEQPVCASIVMLRDADPCPVRQGHDATDHRGAQGFKGELSPEARRRRHREHWQEAREAPRAREGRVLQLSAYCGYLAVGDSHTVYNTFNESGYAPQCACAAAGGRS